jgi:hypothetical protein
MDQVLLLTPHAPQGYLLHRALLCAALLGLLLPCGLMLGCCPLHAGVHLLTGCCC